ncbi:hypothetical protein M3Y99_01866000 [Aphelenchoides fujianensis]|nr:hypothetical protein M3Y99_01866000 [Aphelenchoides fujianensis]
MECGHQELFTTFARVQVTPSGPKPAGAKKRTSVAHSLPWAHEKAFHFNSTKPSWFRGKFKVGLHVEGAGTDFETCLWTEDAKGKPIAGKKDEFSGILSPILPASENTAFACVKIRSIVCPLCPTVAEKPQQPAEPPSRSAVIKAHTEEPTFENYVRAPTDEEDGERKDAPDSGLDSQSAEQHDEPAEWEDERQQSDEDEEDDYVPHWQRNNPRYRPPPRKLLPPRWRDDSPDTDDEPAVLEHPMNADW